MQESLKLSENPINRVSSEILIKTNIDYDKTMITPTGNGIKFFNFTTNKTAIESGSKTDLNVANFDSNDNTMSNPEFIKSQELFRKKKNSKVSSILFSGAFESKRFNSSSLDYNFIENKRINHLLRTPNNLFNDNHNLATKSRYHKSVETSLSRTVSLTRNKQRSSNFFYNNTKSNKNMSVNLLKNIASNDYSKNISRNSRNSQIITNSKLNDSKSWSHINFKRKVESFKSNIKSDLQSKTLISSVNSTSSRISDSSRSTQRIFTGSTNRNNIFMDLKSNVNHQERKLASSKYLTENKVKISRDEARASLDDNFEKYINDIKKIN